jgi:hypothetical protein
MRHKDWSAESSPSKPIQWRRVSRMASRSAIWARNSTSIGCHFRCTSCLRAATFSSDRQWLSFPSRILTFQTGLRSECLSTARSGLDERLLCARGHSFDSVRRVVSVDARFAHRRQIGDHGGGVLSQKAQPVTSEWSWRSSAKPGSQPLFRRK